VEAAAGTCRNLGEKVAATAPLRPAGRLGSPGSRTPVMRSVLLIVTLWLLLDVLLVGAWTGARSLMGWWGRSRAERISSSARL